MSRTVILALSLIVSLVAPAHSMAHGLAHAHLAEGHAGHTGHTGHTGDTAAPAAAVVLAEPQLEPTEHAHQHDHETVAVAYGGRDSLRHVVAIGPATVVAAAAPLATMVVVRSPALTDRALLARPAPGLGRPPSLRAPPVR